MTRVIPALLLLLSSGCRKIDAAPQELDALLHYLWTHAEDGDDELLAEGIRNLDAAVKAKTLEDAEDGTIKPLTKEDAALVGVTDRNPKDAPGVYLANRYACDRADLEAILVYPQQDVIYTDVYDAYWRTYTGDREAFLAEQTDELTWDLEYTASILGATYVARSTALLRRIPELDAEQTPWGPVVVARIYMPEPAEFENENKSQDQDYQLELYWERDPGEIIHVYGLWREANFGSGFTSEDTTVQRILLNNLADWDDTTEQLCADGLP